MRLRSRGLARALALIALLSLCVATPAAQQPDELVPPPLRPQAGGGDPHVEELLRLLGRIERNLREIDALLVEAGSVDAPRAAARAAGAFVREGHERGRQVLDDIDAILDLVCDCPGGS